MRRHAFLKAFRFDQHLLRNLFLMSMEITVVLEKWISGFDIDVQATAKTGGLNGCLVLVAACGQPAVNLSAKLSPLVYKCPEVSASANRMPASLMCTPQLSGFMYPFKVLPGQSYLILREIIVFKLWLIEKISFYKFLQYQKPRAYMYNNIQSQSGQRKHSIWVYTRGHLLMDESFQRIHLQRRASHRGASKHPHPPKIVSTVLIYHSRTVRLSLLLTAAAADARTPGLTGSDYWGRDI